MPMLGYIRRYFVHYDEEKNFVFAVREPVSKKRQSSDLDLVATCATQRNAAGAKAAAALVKKGLVYVGIIVIYFQ